MLGEAGADAPDREHREAAVHEEDEVGRGLKLRVESFFFFFCFFHFLVSFSLLFFSLSLFFISPLSLRNQKKPKKQLILHSPA